MTLDELERWLEEGARVRAPEGFTDAVMSRVAAAERMRPALSALPPVLPWWVRASAEPAAAAAALLMALLLWKGAALLARAVELTQALRAAALALPAAHLNATSEALGLGLLAVLVPAAWGDSTPGASARSAGSRVPR